MAMMDQRSLYDLSGAPPAHLWRRIAAGRVCDLCMEAQATNHFDDSGACPRATQGHASARLPARVSAPSSRALESGPGAPWR
jgi:hypothetical protein